MTKLEQITCNSSAKEISLKQFEEVFKNDSRKDRVRKMLENKGFKFVKKIEHPINENEFTSNNLPDNFKEKVVYRVPNSSYLTTIKEYSALDPLEEALAISAIKLGKQIAKHLEALDEKAIEELKNAGYYSVLKAKVRKAEKEEQRLLLSYVPYITKRITDFFNVRLIDIDKLDDYIGDCLITVKEALDKYDIRIGGVLKRYMQWDIYARIRKTFGCIGGNCFLSESQVIERTKVFKIRQENPNITNEEIANKLGLTTGSKTFYNCLQRIEKYDNWQTSANGVERENDYYGTLDSTYDAYDCCTSYQNPIEESLELEAKKETVKNILDYVKKSFSEEYTEMFVMRYNLNNEFDGYPTYDVIAEKFNTTKQNVCGICKRILVALREAVDAGTLVALYL